MKILISTLAFSACGKSSSREEKPSPVIKEGEIPLTTPVEVEDKMYYGAFVGCVTTITPESPENITTTKWKTTIGCSKVFEASTEVELQKIMDTEVTNKCPTEIFSMTVIGSDTFRCTMKPNKPIFFSSNQKEAAATFTYGGIICAKNVSDITIPTLPAVSCIKQ